MALPSLESAKKFLASSTSVRRRVLAIAKRLEALNEYHSEQALIVAVDIVMHSVRRLGSSQDLRQV